MKVNESCNDTHLVDVILNKDDVKALLEGKVAHIECVKDETEIFICVKDKNNGNK